MRMFSPGPAVARDVSGRCIVVIFETQKQQPLRDL